MNMPRPPATPKYSEDQAAIVSMNKVKEAMTNQLMMLLYGEVVNELHAELSDIADAHCTATNTVHPSFMYCGKYYNLADSAAHSPLPLDPSLHQRMREYLDQYHQVHNYEIVCIKGILKSMYMASDRISDYKQVLPEAVHVAFDGFTLVNPRRVMLPQEIERLRNRIKPFISVMKGRMLHNRLINRGQP